MLALGSAESLYQSSERKNVVRQVVGAIVSPSFGESGSPT